MQQVGGSVGTALLSTIAASAAASYATSHAGQVATPMALQQLAAVHSYTTAFWVAAAVFAAGAVISALLIPNGTLPVTEGDEAPAMAH